MACDVNIGMCADGSKARKEIQKTQKSTKGFGKDAKKSFGNIAKAAGLAGGAMLALTKTIQFIKGSIRSVSEFEVAVKKLDNVIRVTGGAAGFTTDEMIRMAEEMQSLTTISTSAAVEAQGILATFTQIGREVFPDALEAAADMSEMFGQDLRQSVIQLGTALNDPIRGTGRLMRIGISFTQQQRDMIEVLTETGDVLGAQRVILEELQREFGGAARAARDTFGGSIKTLQNNFSDLQRQIGGLITEEGGLGDFIKAINEFLEVPQNFRNIIRAFQIMGATAVVAFKSTIFAIKLTLDSTRLLFSALTDIKSVLEIIFDPANLKPGRMKAAFKDLPFSTVEGFRTIKSDIIKLSGDIGDAFAGALDPNLPDQIIQPLRRSVVETGEAIGVASGQVDRLGISVGEWNRITQQSLILADGFQGSIDLTTQLIEMNTEAMKENKTVMQELGLTAEFAGTTFEQSWTSSLESAFATTDDLGTKMKNLMKELFASLLTAIGQQMAVASAAYFLNFQFGRGAAAAALAGLAFTGAAAIRSLQQGGVVPGRGGGDVTPALLEPGEVVLSKETVSRNQGMITAMEGGMGGMAPMQIFIGGRLIFDTINEGIENGDITITQEDIIPV